MKRMPDPSTEPNDSMECTNALCVDAVLLSVSIGTNALLFSIIEDVGARKP